MCGGCYNDFYNHRQSDGCWSFENATIVKRVRVGTWEPPPYAKERATPCLSCYHAEGSSMLELTDCRVKSMTLIYLTHHKTEKETCQQYAG